MKLQLLNFRGLLWLLPLLLLAVGARAQTPVVRVTVVPLPPYSTHLSDYADQPNRLLITLSNTSRQAVSLQLAATLTGDNGVSARTKPDARSPRPVNLAALQTRQLDADELGQLFDENMLTYTGVSVQEIVRGNGLPEGTYTICVKAMDYATGRLLSAEAPVGCSRPFSLRSLEAPYIIRPLADENIRPNAPQNIVFTWSRPAGAPVTTEYELRIVEMSDPRRNPNDAFLAGTVPPLFERTVSGATVLLYGPGEPALIQGRRYAFAVTARDPRNRTVFRNNGRSEVQTFVYGTVPAGAPATASTPTKPTKTVKPVDVKTTLPMTTIKGRLVWGFRSSEEKAGGAWANLTPTPVFDESNGAIATVLADPSYGPGGAGILTGGASHAKAGSHGPAGSGTSSGGASGVSGGSVSSGVSSGNTGTGGFSGGGMGNSAFGTFGGGSGSGGSGGSSSGSSAGGGGLLSATLPNPQNALNNGGSAGGVASVLGGGVTSGVGFGGASGSGSYSTPGQVTLGAAPKQVLPQFMGSQRYPLGKTKVRLVFDYKPIAPNQPGYSDQILNATKSIVLGLGTTNAEGEFNISYMNPGQFDEAGGLAVLAGSKAKTITAIRVEVDNPRFYSEPVAFDVPEPKNGEYDLGEVACMANSYRLKVNLTDGKNPITKGVKIELLRPTNWYATNAYARPEGQLPEGKRPTEDFFVNLTKVTETSSVGLDLTRLLANVANPDDTYLVRISGEGYQASMTTLQVQPPAGPPSNGVLTVTKTYTLTPMPPVVQGRVLRKQDNSPIQGATVRLYRGPMDKPDWQFNTETDAKGHFSIALKTSNLYEWTLLVTGTGVASNYEEKHIKVNKTGPAGIINRDPILIDATQYPLAGRVVSDEGGAGVAAAALQWRSGGAPFTADDQGRFLTLHQSGPDTLLVSKLGYQPRKVPVFVEGDGKTKPGKKGKGVTSIDLGIPGGMAQAANSVATTVQGFPSMQPGGLGSGSSSGSGSGAGSGKKGKKGNDAGSSAPGTGTTGGTLYNPMPGLGIGGDITNSYVDLLQSAGIGQGVPVGEGQDLGLITLTKSVGRLLVTVLDSASKKPLAGAEVSFMDASPAVSATANASGRAFFGKAPGGPVTVRVAGAAGSAVAYVPSLTDVTVATNGDTTRLSVKLASGTRVAGSVTSGGTAVAGAKIRVQGRPELEATTGAAGTYELVGVPAGQWTLEATKSGLVGQSKTQKFKAGANATVDFALTGAGFAIDKLLGFPIEIKEGGLKMGADTTLTGAFVTLPGNPVFEAAPGATLAFTKVAVRLDKSGVLRPKGQTFVQTDAPELSFKAFKFLPIRLKAATGLRVQMLADNPSLGQLVGQPEIDFGPLNGALGWAFPAGTTQYLSDAAGTGPVPDMPALFAGTPTLPTSLRLRAAGSSASLTLYGFKATIDLQKSSVGTDGLHLSGDVQLSGIPGLGTTKVGMPELWLSTSGEIKKADLSFSPAPSVSLGPWGLTLSSGSLSEQGFSLGGKLKLAVPGSAPSEVTFSKLSIGASMLYGGSFTLPSGGLDVLKLAKFKPVAGSPISFGQEPGGGAYILSGGAVTSLELLKKELTIKSFAVTTAGKFSAEVPLDYDVSFAGIATLKLSTLKFNTIGELGIDVGGGIQLDLPLVKAEAGGIKYRPGKSPSVDKIGLHFPLAGIGELGGKIEFLNSGFAGQLGFNVVGALKADAQFKYQKVSGDTQFSTYLLASTPPIPIGPGVLLTGLGGGFEYKYKKVTSVTMSGIIGLGGDAGLALNPLSVTVASGPVISGTANLTVAQQKFANASLLLDFPNQLAAVEIKANYSPVPLVSTATAGAKVVISGRQNDTYWMMGVYANAKMLGLLDVNANVLTAWNLNRDKHPEHTAYTNFINPAYLTNGNTVNGAHLLGSTFYGRTKDNAWSRSFADIASGKVWFYNQASVNLDANFKSNAYGLGIASGWGGGADISIAGKSIAGADVGADYAVHGGYNTTDGWNFDGKAGAHLTAWFGSCSDACANKICWGGCFDPCWPIPFADACDVCPIPVGGKVCVHPGITMSYKSKTGAVDVGLDL
ncbi:carboxypeptidase regulatory-like domain-containing protein [Hymenobacter properus]|uniref:Carboxypeptidase regulatory-like domain-containing protein n=1 Tax=Hymenobacter properus TaxID=2791026 RepID=A0A931BEI9_9BACT|nr:carboxypeptidase regulatory-like domain-containing protein [Hymenobacter properus]MBF9142359.1 carboxypeptidase regulatory-like domain-containing protein [Hymenobacter properus]MBR7721166.1 carboxypeptidase regulatory-like domain-containing protein [Microvirga sp. SRT04]